MGVVASLVSVAAAAVRKRRANAGFAVPLLQADVAEGVAFCMPGNMEQPPCTDSGDTARGARFGQRPPCPKLTDGLHSWSLLFGSWQMCRACRTRALLCNMFVIAVSMVLYRCKGAIMRS